MQEQTVDNDIVVGDGIVEVLGGFLVDGMFFELDLDEIDAALAEEPNEEEHLSLEDVKEWLGMRVKELEIKQYGDQCSTR